MMATAMTMAMEMATAMAMVMALEMATLKAIGAMTATARHWLW